MRPAVRLLEPADPPRLGSGEGAALVAEKLALEQRLGNGRAIHRDERLPGAIAVLMDRARDQLLAGAGLAADQDGDGLCRDAADFFVKILHRAAAADERVARGARLADLDRLGGKPRGGDGFAEELEQFLGGEWFEQVIVGAEPGRLDRGLGRAVRGHDDDGQQRLGGVQLRGEIEPVEARQLEIAEHHVERARAAPCSSPSSPRAQCVTRSRCG